MAKNYDAEIEELKQLIRTGTVHSVDKEKLIARVKFDDKNGMISGELQILYRPSTVITDLTELTFNGEVKSHKHEVKVEPWTPAIGDMVVCLYKPDGDGDGFILGGIA
jgi:phage baseplate assembly protein gpV